MICLRNFTLALSLCCAWPALAGNSLPTPHIAGPTRVNSRFPLTLQFSYPPVSWSYYSGPQLDYWVQYWHCRPGVDEKPPEYSEEAWIPFGPGAPYCTSDNNHYVGLAPNTTGDLINVPKRGGLPAVGTWYVRMRLVWWSVTNDNPEEFGPWSAWHRVAVVPSFPDAPKPPNSPYSASRWFHPSGRGHREGHGRVSEPEPIQSLHRPLHSIRRLKRRLWVHVRHQHQ